MEDSSTLMDQHREKLEEIRQLGVDPYAYKYSPTHTTQEIREQFAEVGDQPDETKSVRVAGRIMTKRDHGKSGFAHLQDGSGRLQIYVRQNAVGEEAYQVYQKTRCWRHYWRWRSCFPHPNRRNHGVGE